jgi:hypothetical protein
MVRATPQQETEDPRPLYSTILSLVEKAETVEVHLTQEGEGLRV